MKIELIKLSLYACNINIYFLFSASVRQGAGGKTEAAATETPPPAAAAAAASDGSSPSNASKQ